MKLYWISVAVGGVIFVAAMMLLAKKPARGVVSVNVDVYMRCTLLNDETFIVDEYDFGERRYGGFVRGFRGVLYPIARISRCERVQFQPGEDIK